MNGRRLLLFRTSILAVVGLALHTACGGILSTPIRKILDNPGRYDGEVVTISGDVIESANLVLVRYYRVEDDTGRITVVAKRAVPRRGAHVRVRGTVHQAFAVGDESLTVIVEEPPEH